MSAGGDGRVIIGGGASGVLLACQLLRDPGSAAEVAIIEKAARTGFGLAYGTLDPNHLLNVRASNMSAFADQPDHFWNWLVATGYGAACGDAFCFVPRAIYGRYLASLVPAQRGRLHIIRGECVSLRPLHTGVEVRLTDGATHRGDIAVLATGNEPPASGYGAYQVSPWTEPGQAGVAPGDPLLILGSGLTMIDYVVSLLRARHTGPIFAISRHGLLPRVHRRIEPLRLAIEDVPFGADVSKTLRWLRQCAARARAEGHDWRGVVDGLRPFTQDIWQSWPEPAKRRFLRHARAWWDVHRHRCAPEIDIRIAAAVASGQLTIIAGKVTTIEADDGGARIVYRRRGAGRPETIRVAKIVQCTGIAANPRDSANPLLQHLLRQGLARPDPMGIGIDVTPDCAVIDSRGRASSRLFAVGPLTRGRFWEIVAIPDIRVQCAQLAERIAGRSLAAAE